MGFQVSGKLNVLQSLRIALEYLDSIPTKLCGIYQSLNGLLNVSDSVFYATGKYVGKLCLFTLLRFLDTQLCRLLSRVALQCADLDDLAAQLLLKLSDIDLIARSFLPGPSC